MKPRFKTNYNLDQFPAYEGQEIEGPSLTEQEGYQTIDQIIERCQRGVPLSVATFTPEYEFNDELGDEEVEGIMDSVSRGVDSPDFDLADIPVLNDFLKQQNTPKNEKKEEPSLTPSNSDTSSEN